MFSDDAPLLPIHPSSLLTQEDGLLPDAELTSVTPAIQPHTDASLNTRIGEMSQPKGLFRDRYKILRVIGRGGFGITFLAEDVSLPGAPFCVIKQLCPNVRHPDVLQRAYTYFEREAKTLSQLGSHSQIPRLLDYFQLNGEFYLVQEYIAGQTLIQEVKTQGVQSEPQVRQFLRDILPVLQYIHRHRVIHRDIKPSNILRCQQDQRLVLIDFGAVKEYSRQLGDPLSEDNTRYFIGTPGFAPPEQLLLRVSYGSDIFALGMTCLYLLTGKFPREFNYDPVTGAILWHNAVQISPTFRKILDKMLHLPLKERYRSIDSIIQDLNLESGHSSRANHLTSLSSSDSPTPIAIDNGDYLSPVERAAIAIRQWRHKLNKK